MRSIHCGALLIAGSAMSLCVLSSPCGHCRRLAFALPRCDSHASTFLPPVPRRSFALCASRGGFFSPRCGTMKALTPTPLTYGAGLPAYFATPSCRSASNHVSCLVIAYHHASVTSDFRVSLMASQARRSSPPNRVRYPTDQQFASGCSPRRFEPTQLPSATELWHTPTRTFTVLMWRPHGRTIPAFADSLAAVLCLLTISCASSPPRIPGRRRGTPRSFPCRRRRFALPCAPSPALWYGSRRRRS